MQHVHPRSKQQWCLWRHFWWAHWLRCCYSGLVVWLVKKQMVALLNIQLYSQRKYIISAERMKWVLVLFSWKKTDNYIEDLPNVENADQYVLLCLCNRGFLLCMMVGSGILIPWCWCKCRTRWVWNALCQDCFGKTTQKSLQENFYLMRKCIFIWMGVSRPNTSHLSIRTSAYLWCRRKRRNTKSVQTGVLCSNMVRFLVHYRWTVRFYQNKRTEEYRMRISL